MKTDIHPQYYTDAKVTCACGNTFAVGSTKESIEVEICAACHPFYTGKEKEIDTAGRLDKFRAKMQKAQAAKDDAKKRANAKAKQQKEEENTNHDTQNTKQDKQPETPSSEAELTTGQADKDETENTKG